MRMEADQERPEIPESRRCHPPFPRFLMEHSIFSTKNGIPPFVCTNSHPSQIKSTVFSEYNRLGFHQALT